MVTPQSIAPTNHASREPSPGMSEGVNLLLNAPTHYQISDDHDVQDTIEARCHAQAWSHTPERGNGGTTQNHLDPMAFGASIRVAPYPGWFYPPTHISKYDGETNPDHWLEDYRLAMWTEGSDDDFTIQYLPLFLSSSTKA
jgi:hypothetical protein